MKIIIASNGKEVKIDDCLYEAYKQSARGVLSGSKVNKYFKFYDGFKQLYLHRWVYVQSKGDLPEGYDIHHIDDDPTNNQIDNLELVHRAKHHAHHNKKMVSDPKNNVYVIDRKTPYLGHVKVGGISRSKAFNTREEAEQWVKDTYKELGL